MSISLSRIDQAPEIYSFREYFKKAKGKYPDEIPVASTTQMTSPLNNILTAFPQSSNQSPKNHLPLMIILSVISGAFSLVSHMTSILDKFGDSVKQLLQGSFDVSSLVLAMASFDGLIGKFGGYKSEIDKTKEAA